MHCNAWQKSESRQPLQKWLFIEKHKLHLVLSQQNTRPGGGGGGAWWPLAGSGESRLSPGEEQPCSGFLLPGDGARSVRSRAGAQQSPAGLCATFRCVEKLRWLQRGVWEAQLQTGREHCLRHQFCFVPYPSKLQRDKVKVGFVFLWLLLPCLKAALWQPRGPSANPGVQQRGRVLGRCFSSTALL